jgi:putative addiction module killer protein
MLFTVKEYIAPSEKNRFREWLDSLQDQRARGIVDARLNNIRRGTFGDCESVGEGVFELKIHYGPGYRIYFGRTGKMIVLLLCGGTKRTQNKDIKKAQEYWKEARS